MPSRHKYYMPYGAQEFIGWARNFLEAARAGQAAWGLPAGELDALAAQVDALAAKTSLAAMRMATRTDIHEKGVLLKAAQSAFRCFVNTHINYNPAITDEDRANLRVHVRDAVRTAIGRPTGHVHFIVHPLDEHGHRIAFADEETGKKKLPYGIHGAVLHWQVLADGEQPPARGEDLPHSLLMTSTPYTVSYSPAMAGKRVAYAIAWQNWKGVKGEFGNVIVYVIP